MANIYKQRYIKMANIYKQFNTNDIIYGREKKKAYPMWSDDPLDSDTVQESTLTNMWTSSVQVATWEGNYYYHIYGENTATNLNANPQFSVALGTHAMIQLDHTDDEFKYTYPSNAVYKQFLNFLENDASQSKFSYIDYDGTSERQMDVVYIISVARDRIKDLVDQTHWQLNLSCSVAGASGSLVHLISDPSAPNGATSTSVFGGYLSTYTGTVNINVTSSAFGKFYPKHGVYVLDAAKIQKYVGKTNAALDLTLYTGSASALSNYQPSASLQNMYHMLKYGEFFQARTVEMVQSTHYFCRLYHNEFNYSTNPTWVSGSNNQIKDDFYTEPKTFITAIGLYDGDDVNGKLVAIAKPSRPIPKDDTTEWNIKVRLDF